MTTELQPWEVWTLETMPENVRAYIGMMPERMQAEYLAQNTREEIEDEMKSFFNPCDVPSKEELA